AALLHRLPVGEAGAHGAGDQVVDKAVARHDVAGREVRVVAPDIAHAAAGLRHQQGAGGDVPGAEGDFPEAINPPAGDVGEIEGGGACPAEVAGAGEQCL